MMLMNSKKFGLLIESIVKEKKISYLEALVLFCDKNEIDPSTISPMINKALKEKIQIEAEKLKLIKGTPCATLPI